MQSRDLFFPLASPGRADMRDIHVISNCRHHAAVADEGSGRSGASRLKTETRIGENSAGSPVCTLSAAVGLPAFLRRVGPYQRPEKIDEPTQTYSLHEGNKRFSRWSSPENLEQAPTARPCLVSYHMTTGGHTPAERVEVPLALLVVILKTRQRKDSKYC